MNTNDAMNILNLCGTVSQQEISKAYKVASLKFHPDRNPAGQEMMKAVNEAYAFLKNLDVVSMGDDFTAYDYGETLNNVLNELLKMAGLIIEVCGNWIWIDGETKANKENIKNLGCFWAMKKKMWYYRPAEYKSKNRKTFSMNQIRKAHGSQSVKEKVKKQIAA